ncbi:hypothetical protein XENOCAPTIV_017128 [Xenoophorus captivus]|uniref:Uncharacterized protein n=1 Tax=Xenoophorus captivus TaxID=1517983 RepID=A0ABV0RCJ9_9TELE
MLRRESDTHSLFTSGETSDNDCEMGASCEEVEIVCLCEAGPCTLYSEAHAPTLVSAQASHLSVCGRRSARSEAFSSCSCAVNMRL